MQAIFLLAGQNTRYYPLNTGPHKAMTRLYGKLLVAYAVEAFMKAGVKDFIFVTGPDSEEIKTYFGSWDISANFVIQPQPGGQGDALLCAKDYIQWHVS